MEKDDEVKGSGNSLNYTFRMYDPRVSRFFAVDPLGLYYPELSPYQFAGLSPIQNIDLEGLEGFQYLEYRKMKDGSTQTKRVVEITIHVAVSEQSNSVHYKAADLKIIEANLNDEFNKTQFKDFQGHDVEFRFDVRKFNVDETEASEFAKQLTREKDNFVADKKMETFHPKGAVMVRKKIVKEGTTHRNVATIANKADNPSHTQAHEVSHLFLNYAPQLNPSNKEGHIKAGGIFSPVKIGSDPSSSPEGLTQENVNLFLFSLPESGNIIIENND